MTFKRIHTEEKFKDILLYNKYLKVIHTYRKNEPERKYLSLFIIHENSFLDRFFMRYNEEEKYFYTYNTNDSMTRYLKLVLQRLKIPHEYIRKDDNYFLIIRDKYVEF